MTYTKEQVTEGISKLITDYEELKKRKTARKERLEDIGEANVRADFIDPLFEILGWNVRNPDEYDRENYVRGAGFVDIALKLSDRSGITAEDKAKVFIEAKRFGGVPNLTDRTFQKTLLGKTIYADWTEEERQILNYASKTLDVKWAILTNFEKFRLFNARTGVTILNIEKPKELLERIDELLFLTNDSIETDRIDLLETRIERPDVDNEFLDLMNTWRLKIAKSIYENNRNKTFEIKDEKIVLSFNSEEEREKSIELIKEATQRILDRLIIVKYAEDKFVIDPEQLEEKNRSWKRTKDYSSLFYELNGFFRGFWGKHDSKIFEPDHICEKVKVNDKVLSNIIDGICGMNFRKFTSDILGNTYESYLGHELYFNESEELNIRPNRQLKKSGGIYYTPSYVVSYIVENTLGIKLEEIWNDAEQLLDKGNYKEAYDRFKDVSKIKVLDPACGSGSFLVKAFNLIKEYYERYNKKIEEIQQIKNKEFVEKKGNQLNLEEERFLTKISNFEKQILKKNIYGVDLDPSACEIASVNLMLQALKSGEKLPLILDENIKVGNSLISGLIKELKDYFDDIKKIKLFNWEEEFEEVFEEGGFDVVIGNPPYVNVELIDENERNYLMDKYSTATKRFDYYIPFIQQSHSKLKKNGYFSFIIPYPSTYERYAVKMREMVLKECNACEIVNLSKFKIFKDATVRNILLIFTKNNVKSTEWKFKILTQLEDPNITKKIEGIIVHIPKDTYENLPSKMFRLELIEDDLVLKEKIDSKSMPLSALCYVNWGARSANIKEFVVDKPTNPLCKKMLDGKDIKRYSISLKEEKYLIYDTEKLYNPMFRELFENEKIIVPDVTGKEGVVAAYDKESYYTEHTVSLCVMWNKLIRVKRKGLVIPEGSIELSKNYDIKYILGCINSKLVNYIFKKFLSGELHTYPNDVKSFPVRIVDFSEAEEKIMHDRLVALVDKILILNKQKSELLNLFKDLIKKFRQTKEFKPLSDYYTTKKSISLEDYTEDRAHRENGINKYWLNIIKSQELIDYKEEGKITKIDCKEKGNFLILRVRLEGEKNFREMLKIYFEEELMMRFFHFSIKTYLLEKERKKYWSKERIWEVLDKIKIPRSVPNVDTDARNIKQLMKTFEEAYMGELSKEFKESPLKELNLTKIEEEIEKTDNQIDQKVYELYGLTEEEIGMVEKSL